MDSVVRRKFEIPDPPGPHLARERLLARLREGIGPAKRLTLVLGGPGSGKSCLVADHARRAPIAAWYRLTVADRDPIVFATHLLACLGERLDFLSERPDPKPGTHVGSALATAFGHLCDDLAANLRAPLILVVDECQHLPASRPLAEGLEALVRFFPEGSQLLLSGRGFASLGLAAYDLRDELVSVGDRDLAFTQEEIAALLATATGAKADPDEAERIADRTRGWAIAVAHAVRRVCGAPASFLDQPDSLHSYISQEVFPELQPAFRRQLLACAHLSRMDRDACGALLGPGGEDFQQGVRRLGTFVIRAGDRYEFHPLFREFLLREFHESLPDAEKRAVLRRLAAVATTPEERISLLQQAGDWDRAESELVNLLPALLATGRPAIGWTLLSGFPAGRLGDSRYLRYVEGSLHVNDGRVEEGKYSLRVAERLAEQEGDRAALGTIWAALSLASALLGEIDQQAQYAELGIATLPEKAGSALAACLNSRGLSRLHRRDFAMADSDFQAAQELAGKTHGPNGEAYALHNLGYSAAWRGEHAHAVDRYRAAIAHAKLGNVVPRPLTYANLAVSYLCLGRPGACWEALEDGFSLAERQGATRDRSYLLWAAGLLHERQGDVPKARSALTESLTAAEACGDRLARMQAHLGLAAIALRLGNLDEARREVAWALSAAGKAPDDPDVASAALTQPTPALRKDDGERVRKVLSQISRTVELLPTPYLECWTERLWAAFCRTAGIPAGEAIGPERLRDLARRFDFAVPGEWPSPLPAVDPGSIAVLQVRCFGPFEATIKGRAVDRWSAARAKALLAFLVLNPGGVTRQKLVEVLYPDQEVSRSALHTALARLREALEPECRQGVASRFVIFSGGRYGLSPDTPTWSDVAEFLRLLGQATEDGATPGSRRALLERASWLYTGPLLPEFQELPWVRVEAERLRGLALKTFEELLALAGAADDWEALEAYADRALNVEICHHPSIRAKMVALAMQERRAEAMRYGARIATNPCGCAVADEDLHELLKLLASGPVTVKAIRCFLPPLP